MSEQDIRPGYSSPQCPEYEHDWQPIPEWVRCRKCGYQEPQWVNIDRRLWRLETAVTIERLLEGKE